MAKKTKDIPGVAHPVDEAPKTVTVKFEQLQKVNQIWGFLLLDETFEKTKFSYAFKRFIEKNKKFYTDYNEALQEIRIDNALTDEKTKELLLDNTPGSRGFKFSKDDFKKLVKEERAISEKFNQKDCEVEPYLFKGETASFDLDEEAIEVLTGLII